MQGRLRLIPPETRTFVGERADAPDDDELQHFFLCSACQQPVDMRDLGVVFHHEIDGHRPLPAREAERLLDIANQLRRALTPRESGREAGAAVRR